MFQQSVLVAAKSDKDKTPNALFCRFPITTKFICTVLTSKRNIGHDSIEIYCKFHDFSTTYMLCNHDAFHVFFLEWGTNNSGNSHELPFVDAFYFLMKEIDSFTMKNNRDYS